MIFDEDELIGIRILDMPDRLGSHHVLPDRLQMLTAPSNVA